MDNYFQPLQESFDDFLKRNGHSDEARAIVETQAGEIESYNGYKDYFSYGVYIARKEL